MSKWIKLMDRHPVKEDVYRVLMFSGWNNRWIEDYLKWYPSMGFQIIDYYNTNGAYPIEMDVAYWLETEIPLAPISEAESLIIDTEVFFHKLGLEKFALENNLEIFAKYGNATEYVISGVSEQILSTLRHHFVSQMKHKHIRKR